MNSKGQELAKIKKEKIKQLQIKARKIVARNVARSRSTSCQRAGQVVPLNLEPRSKSEERTEPELSTVSPAKLSPIRPPGVEIIDTNLLYPMQMPYEPPDLNSIELEKPPQTQESMEVNKEDEKQQDQKQSESHHIAEPIWLQPSPYNFINTVKRKLQQAVNSPKSYVDVGVQNSSISSSSKVQTPEPSHQKSKEEIRELLLKSTLSDRNLDLKAVENLELKRKSSKSKRVDVGGLKRPISVSDTSESYTSKNIPDISSESVASYLRRQLSEAISNQTGKSVRNLDSHLKSGTSSIGWDGDKYSFESRKTETHNINAGSKSVAPSASTPTSTINTDTNNVASRTDNLTLTKSHSEARSRKFSGISNPRVEDSQRTLRTERQVSKSVAPSTSSPTSIINTDTINVVSRTENLTLPKNHSEARRRKFSGISNPPIEDSQRNLRTERQVSDTTKSISEISEEIISTKKKFATDSIPDIFSAKSSVEKTYGDFLALKEPKISLNTRINKNVNLRMDRMKNVTIRSSRLDGNDRANDIHLQFEAEVRLLNDFHECRRQFNDVSRDFENLKDQTFDSIGVLQNVDTQTSFLTKTSSTVTSTQNYLRERNNSQTERNPSINYSRGSNISEIEELVLEGSTARKSLNNTVLTSLNLSDLNMTTGTDVSVMNESRSLIPLSNIENHDTRNCAGLSLNMFEQLMKDEDARIENLRAIIKIRYQALHDRTKSELSCLEIQRKQLIETGRMEEASIIKKKQRGILLKHEEEKNEMKKLQQLQKKASAERKSVLRRQRKILKSQLSTDKMLSKIKVNKSRESRNVGPLKVHKNSSESLHSEISFSVQSSAPEEELIATSHTRPLKVREQHETDVEASADEISISEARRTLLMREAALQKRRKAAEELLLWYEKLLEEEKKIVELEATAASVVKRIASEAKGPTGKKVDHLLKSITQNGDGKLPEEKVQKMSQMASERSTHTNKRHSPRSNEVTNNENVTFTGELSVDDSVKNSHPVQSEEINSATKYSSSFESESVHEVINSGEEQTNISSISQLINNFSRIEDEISIIKKSEESIFATSVVEIIDLTGEDDELNTEISELNIPSESNKVSELTSLNPEETVGANVEENEEQVISLDDSRTTEKTAEELQTKSSAKQSVSEELSLKTRLEETEKAPVERDTNVSPVITSDSKKTELSASITTSAKEPTSSVETSETEVEESDSSREVLYKTYIINEDKLGHCLTEDLSLNEALEAASNIEDSLTKFNEQLTKSEQVITENKSITTEEPINEESDTTISSNYLKSQTEKSEESNSKVQDVKKRVSEILADSCGHGNRDESPRLQDLYVTAYVTPPDENRELSNDIFDSEAEELWRKQMAIEQEIKQLEQQQKEQLPYMYVREIPNKPPPPYTPPSLLPLIHHSTFPSDTKEIDELTNYSSKIIYKAFQKNALDSTKFSENSFKLCSALDIPKERGEFMFEVCKDLVKDYYKQFEKVDEPSWLMLETKPQLATAKPLDADGLEKYLNKKLKNLFGFTREEIKESAIIKWGRKRRDHVDEILVTESQIEEAEWTNFQKDELRVKDRLTNNIMKILLGETADTFAKILSKRSE